MSTKQKIVTIEKTDKKEFDVQVNIMVNQGYKIESTHNISNKYSLTLSYSYDENDTLYFYENDFVKHHCRWKNNNSHIGEVEEENIYFKNGIILYKCKGNKFEIFYECGRTRFKGNYPLDSEPKVEFNTIDGKEFYGRYCGIGSGGGSGRYDFYIRSISEHISSGIDKGICFRNNGFHQYIRDEYYMSRVKPYLHFEIIKKNNLEICITHFSKSCKIHSISYYEIRNNDFTKFIPKKIEFYNEGKLLIKYDRKFYVDLFDYVDGYRGHYNSINHDGVLHLYDSDGREIIKIENLFLNIKRYYDSFFLWDNPYRDRILNDSQKIISWRWKIPKKYSKGELLINLIPENKIKSHEGNRSRCTYINKFKYYDSNNELVLELEGCDSELDSHGVGHGCFWRGNKIKDVYIKNYGNSCISFIIDFFQTNTIMEKMRNPNSDDDFFKKYNELIKSLFKIEELDETYEENLEKWKISLKESPIFKNKVLKKITEERLSRIEDIIKHNKNKF